MFTWIRKLFKRKPHEQIYLSRRNLLSLLAKLDRNKAAGSQVSVCTIVKEDDIHPKYPQSMRSIFVTALEDEEYYSHRKPGRMFEDTVA